jgi:predicted RNA-binding Zn-ribbon protein involved in translation (DUF1610 family)
LAGTLGTGGAAHDPARELAGSLANAAAFNCAVTGETLTWIMASAAKCGDQEQRQSNAREADMTRVPDGREEKCTRCGSHLIDAEWEEQVSAAEVQYLWRCESCGNEFVTRLASAEKQPSDVETTEVIRPFFTSLVVE